VKRNKQIINKEIRKKEKPCYLLGLPSAQARVIVIVKQGGLE
jgi:hypothetical protein